MTDTIVIDRKTANKPGSSLELREGEVVTVNDLLKGLIVVSGNDAAYALAVKTAGSEEAFVKLMNKKAEELGLKSATFHNASGYPLDDGTNNTMSAKDLALLSGYVIDQFPEVVNYSKIQILDMPERGFSKRTTIPLIGTVRGVDGLKTGMTDDAGFCLVSTMNLKDNPDHRIVSVVMGATGVRGRDNSQIQILNYVADRFKPVKILDKNSLFTSTVVNSCEERIIGLQPARDYDGLFDENKMVYKDVTLNKVIKAPIKKGDVLGKVTIYIGRDGKEEIDLVADKNYATADPFTRLKRCMGYAYRLVQKLWQV